MPGIAPREQIRIGDTTVTFLPDGEVRLNPAVFPASAPSGWARHASYLDEDGRLPISVGSFLIRTPTYNALVDLGLGKVEFDVPDFAHFRAGRLLESLCDEGLRPADIDAVLFTHLHHDHVGWTTNVAPAPNASADQLAGLTFARATHYVGREEWQHWSGTDDIVGPHPEAVQRPLAEALRFYDEPGFDLPGLRVLPTDGHTPGHSSIVVSDPRSDRRIVILGDVMHSQVQVSDPDWNFRFDVDQERSRQTRKKVLNRFAGSDDVIAGGHFAGSVFGRIVPPALIHRWASYRLTAGEIAPVDTVA